MQPFETETGNPKPQAQPTNPTVEQNSQPQGEATQPQDQNPQNQGVQYPQQPQVQNQPQTQYPQFQNQYPQPQGQNQGQYPQPQGGQYPQYQGQQYPQPQGQYPQAQRPSYPQAQPQGQYPQPQGQYPQAQAQRPTYPNSQQGPHQPKPQNYQAPYPNRPSQYPAAGYPNYQAQPQPQYVTYNQGADKGQDLFQKRMMMQQLSRNNKSSGGILVALYSLFAAVVAVGIGYTLMNQTNYQVLLQAYQSIAGRDFDPADAFSRDTCQAFLADIISIPIFLYGFAIFNFFAMCVSFTGLTGCMFVQALAALGWGGLAIFTSQQQCGITYTILTKLFGADNIPQNAWPYYAALAAASLVACILNNAWSSSKDKAQRDQRNLALMMAAS